MKCTDGTREYEITPIGLTFEPESGTVIYVLVDEVPELGSTDASLILSLGDMPRLPGRFVGGPNGSRWLETDEGWLVWWRYD